MEESMRETQRNKEGARLMLLGGSAYLLPVIDAAHALGCTVITCDYLPDNYAHRFSDHYENVSIVDREAVLASARRLDITAIMSFAADPGVVTAAYVAEKMGLFCQGSLDAVETLQDKVRFRDFLQANGFAVPRHYPCASVEEALDRFDGSWGTVVVKPVDSAGAKGVSRAADTLQLRHAVERALACSRSGRCIVEEWVDGAGGIIETDAFSIDGIVQDLVVSDQTHDSASFNPIAPIGSIIPTRAGADAVFALRASLQSLVGALGLRTGIYNVEARVGGDGKLYLMEVSPRGAGANIALIQHEAGGPDLIEASVRAALGMEVVLPPWKLKEGVFFHDMLHARDDGVFEGVEYVPGFREEHVIRQTLWIEPGSCVRGMRGSGDAFGSLLLRFENDDELDAFLKNPEAGYRVVVR